MCANFSPIHQVQVLQIRILESVLNLHEVSSSFHCTRVRSMGSPSDPKRCSPSAGNNVGKTGRIEHEKPSCVIVVELTQMF